MNSPIYLRATSWLLSCAGLCALLLVGCDKDDGPDYSSGEMTATVNGKPWRGVLRMNYSVGDLGIDMTGFFLEGGDEYDDEINFARVPAQPGIYPLVDTFRELGLRLPSAFYIESNGLDHGVRGTYIPLNRVPGEYIEVISFDSTTTELIAEFRGVYYNQLRDSDYVRKRGDTLVIENGRIKGRFTQ